MKTCQQCQTENVPSAAFCANCGVSFLTRSIRPINKAPKPKETKWVLIAGISAIVLVGFALIFAAVSRMSAPNKTASQPVVITSSAQYTPTPVAQSSAQIEAFTRASVVEQISVRTEWEKGGFGTVLLADVYLTNKSSQSVKDIVIDCAMFAPSKTRLGNAKQTIYERLYPGQTADFKKVNLGFLHSQTDSVGCVVTDATVLD